MSQFFVDKLIATKNIREAIKYLDESHILEHSIKYKDNIEAVLDEEIVYFLKIMRQITNISPFRFLFFLFASKYIFHNIKVMFKSKYSQQDYKQQIYPIADIDNNAIDQAINDEKYDNLPFSYQKILIKTKDQFREMKNDPAIIDIILDKERFGLLDNIISETENIESEESYLRSLIRIEKDIRNIMSAIRIKARNHNKRILENVLIDSASSIAKKLMSIFNNPLNNWKESFVDTEYYQMIDEGLDYFEKNNSFSYLDKLFDDYLIGYIKIGKWTIFGIEPLAGFMLAKEMDLKNIRFILNSKIAGISQKEIQESVRNCYV